MNNLLLQSINLTTVLTVVGIVAAISIIFAALIVLVSKLCAVEEDEKGFQALQSKILKQISEVKDVGLFSIVS